MNLDLSYSMNTVMQQLQGLTLHIVNSETESNLGTFDRSYHGRRNIRHQSLNVVFTGHFCLGWCSNFVSSESIQKKNVKFLQICSTTQLNSQHPPPPPPPPATHCLYILYVYFGKGGEVKEKVEGQQYTRGVENTNMTDFISSL